jgi:hypothetical protein
MRSNTGGEFMTTENQQYEVGFGKPPASTQFQRGTSGNPGGNYKHTPHADAAYKRLGAMLLAELREYQCKHSVEEAVKRSIIAACEAEDWKEAHAALKQLALCLDGKPQQRVDVNVSVDIKLVQVEALVLLRKSLTLEEAIEQQTAQLRAIYAADDDSCRDVIEAVLEANDEQLGAVWAESEQRVREREGKWSD